MFKNREKCILAKADFKRNKSNESVEETLQQQGFYEHLVAAGIKLPEPANADKIREIMYDAEADTKPESPSTDERLLEATGMNGAASKLLGKMAISSVIYLDNLDKINKCCLNMIIDKGRQENINKDFSNITKEMNLLIDNSIIDKYYKNNKLSLVDNDNVRELLLDIYTNFHLIADKIKNYKLKQEADRRPVFTRIDYSKTPNIFRLQENLISKEDFEGFSKSKIYRNKRDIINDSEIFEEQLIFCALERSNDRIELWNKDPNLFIEQNYENIDIEQFIEQFDEYDIQENEQDFEL